MDNYIKFFNLQNNFTKNDLDIAADNKFKEVYTYNLPKEYEKIIIKKIYEMYDKANHDLSLINSSNHDLSLINSSNHDLSLINSSNNPFILNPFNNCLLNNMNSNANHYSKSKSSSQVLQADGSILIKEIIKQNNNGKIVETLKTFKKLPNGQIIPMLT
jgi:hypothetical protein